ncbi:hypothetical protein INS49_010543 [Diaporthe citri]|uniref:uncharacterized protein n=1 Tax=Diaporthe citri TaxID=83186 RepID=UPI001C81ECFE|nr:uncharacterized protein INS49_010543 [Diaporthe citri]KAG6362313.1 hypothetical protein INS49_010543 [Diaporthe citri]
MAKIAHPVAHELGITRRKLEEANQQLAVARAEIEILRDEVARLRQHVPPEFKMRPRLSSQSTPPLHPKRIQSSIPRYAQPTQASEQRTMKSTTQPQNQTTTFGTVTLTIKLSDTQYRDLMDLITLLPATRLEDDELQKTSMKHMLIDDGQQASLLVQGRELAQRCLWNLAEEPPAAACFRIDEVDEHLKNVQKMAIQLYDKTGALQARRLRDELRQAAHDTFDEITTLGP